MSIINNIKVYATTPHPCSYIDNREATTLFIDPETNITPLAYTELNDIGFRRSGKHFYIPHCKNCHDCVPTRIPVSQFIPTKRQLRILKKNQDLQSKSIQNIRSDEHYALYEKYIQARHTDGDMHPPNQEQYFQFIGDETRFSRFIEFRDQNKLVAVSVVDELPNSFSAIYTFFDPDQSKRSLGTYSILSTLNDAKNQGKDFVYLGYWIQECKKMNYKIDFRPMELRIEGSWRMLR